MTVADVAGSSDLEIGRVPKLTAAFYTRHWIWLFSLGVPLVLFPEIVARWVIGLPSILATAKGLGIAGSLFSGMISAGVTIVPSAMMISVVAHRAAADLSDDRPSTPFAGLDRVLIVLLTKLISGVGVRIGEILLVVPGIILSMVWAVTGPVAALEQLGPIESLRRSADLTRNRRGAIFQLALVYAGPGPSSVLPHWPSSKPPLAPPSHSGTFRTLNWP